MTITLPAADHRHKRHFPYLTTEEAFNDLRDALPPGATAYTILRHVSSSGMTRAIDVVAIGPDGPQWISPRVAIVTQFGWDARREALKVGGAGMDMGFHVVYSLSAALYGPNPAVPLRRKDRDRLRRYRAAQGKRDPHAGYELRHRWI